MSGREPHPGLILGGRYRLEKELGRGAMGCVWQAEHLTLHSRVAIKTVTGSSKISDAAARFSLEARAAAQLGSPHVVRTFDYGVDDGVAYLVMEQLVGETLGERLRREGALSAQFTCKVLSQIARGVGEAHAAGIIHRDIKPDNVFLARNDDDVIVKVLDFGIAKSLRDFSSGGLQTAAGAVLGTLPYMSPEQVEDGKSVEATSDVWAMAVLAFECLVGRLPFEGYSAPALIKAICHDPLPLPSSMGAPAGFDDWFARGTQRDPTLRFSSVKEAARELKLSLGVVLRDDADIAPTPHTAITAARNTEPSDEAGTGAPLSVPGIATEPRSKLPITLALSAVFGSLVVGAWFWFVPEPEPTANTAPLTDAVQTDREPSHEVSPPTVTARERDGTRATSSRIATAESAPTNHSSTSAPTTVRSSAKGIATAPPATPPATHSGNSPARAPSPTGAEPPQFIDPQPRTTSGPSTPSSSPKRDDKPPLFL